MALSATIFDIDSGSVGQIDFTLAFEGPGNAYLSKNHVHWYLNNILQDTGADGGAGANGFTWTTGVLVQLKAYVPVLNDRIEFRRTVPKDDLYVDFVDNAGITEQLLDNSSLANLYMIHEIMDGYGTGIFTAYELAKAYANADEDYVVEPGPYYSAKHFALKAAAQVALATDQTALATAQAVLADAARVLAEAAETEAEYWAGIAEAAVTNGLLRTTSHTATDGQTVFTHPTDITNETIALNGAILDATDYTIASAVLTLDVGAAVGDIIRISTIGIASANGYVQAAGDTMTGPLVLSGAPTIDLHAATKKYIDDLAVDKAGDTMTGALVLSGAPTIDLHASTKKYVDDEVAGTGGGGGAGLTNTNELINGAMLLAQRRVSSTGIGATIVFVADRWGIKAGTGASVNATWNSFPHADLPTGLQDSTPAKFMTMDVNVAGSTFSFIQQKIENVKHCGEGKWTVSFLAKADASVSADVKYFQSFGSGGSTTVTVTAGTASLTTTWQKFEYTFDIPEMQSKTIGSGSYGMIRMEFPVSANAISLTNMKLEVGEEATPYVEDTFAVNLAKCQRYYEKSWDPFTVPQTNTVNGVMILLKDEATSITENMCTNARFAVTKRAIPTVVIWSQDGSQINSVSLYNSPATRHTITTTYGTSMTMVATWIKSATNFIDSCFAHWTADAEI